MNETTDEHRDHDHRGDERFKLTIDRDAFEVAERGISGQQLRELPKEPIGDDRDLYEEVHGGEDRLIGKADVVALKEDGVTAFFTSPSHVTPGS